MDNNALTQSGSPNPIGDSDSLLADIRSLIDGTRAHVAHTVNAELALLYWNIGDRVNRYILGNERAEYGRRVIDDRAAFCSRQAICRPQQNQHYSFIRRV